MLVTVIGPNLRDQSKGDFHVHAAECGDIARSAVRDPAFRDGWTIDARNCMEIVETIYEDVLRETPEDERETELALCDQSVHICPCVKL
jgi:hypothetical protein